MAHNISMLVADLLGTEAGNVVISNSVTRSQDISRMLGIALVDNVNYFFKEQTPSQYRIEAEFIDKYGSIFKSPKRIAVAHFKNKVLSLYEFYEASSKCAYAHLRSDRSSQDEIKCFIIEHTNRLIGRYERYAKKLTYGHDYPSSTYFEHRVIHRWPKFYGATGNTLLQLLFPFGERQARYYAEKVHEILHSNLGQTKTIYSVTHGDLHDLNYSYEDIYWDLDTAGENPLLAEIIVSIWYYLFQDEVSIPKYRKEYFSFCTKIATHRLDPTLSLWRIEYLAQEFNNLIINLTGPDYSGYHKEIQYRFLCRILLIENIERYDSLDLLRIMKAVALIVDTPYSDQNTFRKLVLDIYAIIDPCALFASKP